MVGVVVAFVFPESKWKKEREERMRTERENSNAEELFKFQNLLTNRYNNFSAGWEKLELESINMVDQILKSLYTKYICFVQTGSR